MLLLLGLTASLVGRCASTPQAPGTGEVGSCPVPCSRLRGDSEPIGVCAGDLEVIGDEPVAVHESVRAPTGIAVGPDRQIYLTYTRNAEEQPSTVTRATSFSEEEPWPSREWQNCTEGQDRSTCFVNVQNIVLDSAGGWWVLDSGIPYQAKRPVPGGPKLIKFNYTTGEVVRTYVLPEPFWREKIQLNDVRINNTLGGPGGSAVLTEDSSFGSLLTLDLATGRWARHLYNTTFTRPDANFTSMYNGEPNRAWNGTTPSFTQSGTNGIALASGNVYWSVKSSHRWYYVPAESLVALLDDDELGALVRVPGNMPSETAGYTADDRGRVYTMAAEQNAIIYVDTRESEVSQPVTAVPPDGTGVVPAENLIHHTLIRSGVVQAADTACILDGDLYFSTNQQALGPSRQYRNIDRRRGPFRSYKLHIGRNPAV